MRRRDTRLHRSPLKHARASRLNSSENTTCRVISIDLIPLGVTAVAQIPLAQIIRETLSFLIVLIIAPLIVILVPDVSLFLLRLFGYASNPRAKMGKMTMTTIGLPERGAFVLRAWVPEAQGPSICRIEGDMLLDVTCAEVPTVRDLLELEDPAGWFEAAPGRPLCALDAIVANSIERPNPGSPYLLAPCDLQPVKACGVTFAASMLERVIEEQAAGDPAKAEAIRARCQAVIGDSLSGLVPGSERAMAVKEALLAEGAWSQYLEVGVGPDAEVFSKAQALSAVGWGASVGLHPISEWNNPEPEVVLAVDSRGVVKGATLGNDVNLRDVEGRSALLLGKAKDNNASCALGPALRLFDDEYSIDDVRKAELTLHVAGEDGFMLHGSSSMSEISRDPLDLVGQTFGAHHQYPDGFMLMMGTLFAPTQDRGEPGGGFTHRLGDVVEIANPALGALRNTVRRSTECPPWSFAASHLMRNLASRGLI